MKLEAHTAPEVMVKVGLRLGIAWEKDGEQRERTERTVRKRQARGRSHSLRPGVTLMSVGFLSEAIQIFRNGRWLHGAVNVPESTELHTLNG